MLIRIHTRREAKKGGERGGEKKKKKKKKKHLPFKRNKLPYAQMFDDGAAFCLAATPCVST